MHMSSDERRAMRRTQVEQCLASDMTIKDWCALNAVPISTMHMWMAKFRREEPELFPQQNAKQWIELTRQELASRTALARTDAQDDTAGAHGADKPIVVRVNTFEVSIPKGSPQADVACVLRVVAGL